MRVTFLVSIFIMLLGCSGKTAVPERATEIVVPRDLNADEAKVIQIARQFVATNQNWPDVEFERPKRGEEGGWSILIWKLPKTPELDMFLTIDDRGRVSHGSIGLGSIDVGEPRTD